jgi:hypothetical protein
MHTDPYLKEAADGEVLVRVDGVGKKFCRSLKKSLWYGKPTKSAVAGNE